MELVVDKEFLNSFFAFNSSERHKSVYDDFVAFVNRLHPGFTLVTNFDSLNELLNVVPENPLLEILASKAKDILYVNDFKGALKSADFYAQGCSVKLCLVACDNKECGYLEKAFGYSFMTGENLSYKWKPFLADREDKERYITSSAGFDDYLRFDTWAKLEKYRHPLHSILIVDKYILTDKRNQSIEQNLKPLLKALLPKNEMAIPIDLTIIAEQDQESIRREPDKFEKIYKNLTAYLAEECPHLQINLSIVKFSPHNLHKMPTDGFKIHDRRIFTNYFWVESGAGFNIMNERGKVADSDSMITFKFHMRGPNYVGCQHLLKGYAAYTNIATEVYGFNKNRLLIQF